MVSWIVVGLLTSVTGELIHTSILPDKEHSPGPLGSLQFLSQPTRIFVQSVGAFAFSTVSLSLLLELGQELLPLFNLGSPGAVQAALQVSYLPVKITHLAYEFPKHLGGLSLGLLCGALGYQVGRYPFVYGLLRDLPPTALRVLFSLYLSGLEALQETTLGNLEDLRRLWEGVKVPGWHRSCSNPESIVRLALSREHAY